MRTFRGRFLAYLRKAVNKGRLVLPPDTTLARMRSLLNRLGRVKWKIQSSSPGALYSGGMQSYHQTVFSRTGCSGTDVRASKA
jgi:hypothetical protein